VSWRHHAVRRVPQPNRGARADNGDVTFHIDHGVLLSQIHSYEEMFRFAEIGNMRLPEIGGASVQ
jgi:hypothetical protein